MDSTTQGHTAGCIYSALFIVIMGFLSVRNGLWDFLLLRKPDQDDPQRIMVLFF